MDLTITIAVLLPMCLVLGAGCIVALASWRKHPRISALACFGSGGLLVLTVGFNAVLMWVPQYLEAMGVDREVTYRVLRIVYSLAMATGYTALLLAVFLGRSSPSLEAAEPGDRRSSRANAPGKGSDELATQS